MRVPESFGFGDDPWEEPRERYYSWGAIVYIGHGDLSAPIRRVYEIRERSTERVVDRAVVPSTEWTVRTFPPYKAVQVEPVVPTREEVERCGPRVCR